MEPHVAMALLKGEADKLTSAFHVTYNMILNLLRVEELNPEYMLERSFFQFQHRAAVPELEASVCLIISVVCVHRRWGAVCTDCRCARV